MKSNTLQAVSALILFLFTALPSQAAEEVTYYHNDQLGSPIAATDSSGTLLWEQAYDPWGYKLTSTTNERAYTGHWEDPDTGLSDYQARWYSPTIGRFTRMDPVVWDENNVKSFNRYAYANNSPYRYTDPDGNIPIDTLWDAGNVLWDIGKITIGLITSNGQMVADGTVDLAADSFALAVPYVPAGASKLTKLGDGLGDAAGVTKKAPDITVPYKRPSGATTKAQRESVQNKPCVDCGATTSRQVADHKTPLVKEYYRTGTIDKSKMRRVDSVQPQCPRCSARQGAEMSRYSKQQKKDLGL